MTEAEHGPTRPYTCVVRPDTVGLSLAEETNQHSEYQTPEPPLYIILKRAVSDSTLGFTALSAHELVLKATSPKAAMTMVKAAGDVDRDNMLTTDTCAAYVTNAEAAKGAPKSSSQYMNISAALDGLFIVGPGGRRNTTPPKVGISDKTEALYYALKGGVPNYKKFIAAVYPQYRNTTDVFAREKIVKSETPAVQQFIKTQGTKPYLSVNISLSLGHYKPGANSFPITSSSATLNPSAYFHIYNEGEGLPVAFVDYPTPQSLRPANKESAVKLESFISANGGTLNAKIYGKAVGTGVTGSRKTLIVDVVRFDLLNQNWKVIGTATADGTFSMR